MRRRNKSKVKKKKKTVFNVLGAGFKSRRKEGESKAMFELADALVQK